MKFINHLIDLRRRRVFRAAGLYLVGAWVLLQIGDVIVEPAGLPAWSMTFLLYVLVAFFPLAIFLGWRYELTEHGLVKTRSLKEQEVEEVDVSLNIKDYLVICAFVVISGMAVFQMFPDVQDEAEQLEAEVSQVIAEANTIAVLPFIDNSPSGGQTFLADGIADSVIHMISKVAALKVTSRTSSFSFKDKQLDTIKIANYLNVAHILEGSVQRVGDEVKVVSRLIDARTGDLIWSGNMLRNAEQIFAIQDEIAKEVVAALKTTVIDSDKSYQITDYQPPLQAYEARLKGLEQFNISTVESLKLAETLFRRAIDLDPDYALAYSDLAWTVIRLEGEKGTSAEEISTKIKPFIEKILAIDPSLSEAHHLDAYIESNYGDRKAAFRGLERALELNPNNAAALRLMSNWMGWQGRNDESLEFAKRAVKIDPNNETSQSFLAQAYWAVSQAERAMSLLKKSLSLNPENVSNYMLMARWLQQKNRTGDALRYVLKAKDLDPESRYTASALCLIYEQIWDFEKAAQCEVEFLDRFPDDLEIRKFSLLRQDRVDEALKLQDQLIEKYPNSVYRKVQKAHIYFHNGRYPEVLSFMREHFSDLLQADVELNQFTQWPAKILAHTLILMEQEQQGLLLLERVEAAINDMRLLQGSGWIAGIEMAEVYAIRGQQGEAMNELVSAINSGWRFYSFGLPNNHHFREYWETNEFQEAVRLLEEEFAFQRAWFEENKNEPLF